MDSELDQKLYQAAPEINPVVGQKCIRVLIKRNKLWIRKKLRFGSGRNSELAKKWIQIWIRDCMGFESGKDPVFGPQMDSDLDQ